MAELAKKVPAPEGKSYRHYQLDGIKFMAERRGSILADDMGLGKTVMAAGLLNLKEPDNVLIVCPASLKFNWRTELRAWLTYKAFILVAQSRKKSELGLVTAKGAKRIVIVNYDLMHALREKLASVQWDVMICDECFTGETPVVTSRGVIPIEKIHENPSGLFVLSWNFSRNEQEWMPVTRVFRNTLKSNLFCIHHEHGKITCTGTHEIWIEGRGYTMAKEIQGGEKVRVLRGDIPDPPQGKEHGDSLFKAMRKSKHICRRKGKDFRLSQKTSLKKDMQGMRGSFRGWRQTKNQQVLFSELRSSMEGEAQRSRAYEKTARSRPKSCKGLEATGSGRANEKTQRRSKISGQGRRSIKKAKGAKLARQKGRQWIPDCSSEEAVRCTQFARVGHGAFYFPEGRGASKIQKSPVSLLRRHRDARDQACNRSGWAQPPLQKVEVSRQEKNRGFVLSRVDRVEVLERGGDGGSGQRFVYDLEVDQNHNYFAGGVLVSNSQYLKSEDSQRTKATLGKGKRKKYPGIPFRSVHFLTGTPIENRPVEIFPLVNAIAWITGDMNPLWESKWNFQGRYCRRNAWGFDPKSAQNMPELHAMLKPILLRRTKREVLAELPAKIRTVIELPPPKEVRMTVDVMKAKYEPAKEAILELKARRIAAREGGNLAAYKKLANDLQARVGATFEELSEELRACGKAKVPLALKHIEMLLEEEPDSKVIVFAHHHEVLDALRGGLAEHGVCGFDGRMTSAAKRHEQVQQFQDGFSERVFVGGITAAGVGITLTRANFVVFVELLWNPSKITQAEDRAHRIGQELPVQVHHLVLEDSVDSDLAQAIVRKQAIIAEAIDGHVRKATMKQAKPNGVKLPECDMSWTALERAENMLRQLDKNWTKPGMGASAMHTEEVRQLGKRISTEEQFRRARWLLHRYRKQFMDSQLEELNIPKG